MVAQPVLGVLSSKDDEKNANVSGEQYYVNALSNHLG